MLGSSLLLMVTLWSLSGVNSLVLTSLLAVSANSVSPLSSSSWSSSINDDACKDGLCSMETSRLDVDPQDSWSNRILSDWKSADNDTESDQSLQPITEQTEKKINASSTKELYVSDDLKLSPEISPIRDVKIDERNVRTLLDMGYHIEEASAALASCQNDLTRAAELLEQQDEALDARRALLSKLVGAGWDQGVAYAALEKCIGNITAAEEMLQQEEEATQQNFNLAVKNMVSAGWSELVARKALLSQWDYDRKVAQGENMTVFDADLQSIMPTLRRLNDTKSAVNHESGKNIAQKTPQMDVEGKIRPHKTGEKKTELPPPAKKEEVVFEVTANNLQKVVLDSPVPVLLDVYADWCGPCKQLGPILENAAIKAGGMFRLAKINSDQERAVSEALGVTGLPTVFTISNGKLTDRFVGMLPTEDLQKYLVRAVTGFGERVQEKEVSETELHDAGAKITQLAGMSSMSFRKKELLSKLVSDTLEVEGAFIDQHGAVLSASMKSVLAHLRSCAADIRNNQLRELNATSVALFFHGSEENKAALRLLEVAGFKAVAEGSTVRRLVHNNSAILTLLLQRVDELVNDRRFSKMKNIAYEMPSHTSSLRLRAALPSRSSSATPSREIPGTSFVRANHVEINKHKTDVVTVSIRISASESSGGRSVQSGELPYHTTLREAVTKLLLVPSGEIDFSRLEVRYPLPRRTLSPDSVELNRPLKTFFSKAEYPMAINLYYDSNKRALIDTTTPIKGGNGSACKSRTAKMTSTLFSTGILRKARQKSNEYFGGDSTVVSGGDDSDVLGDE